MAPPLTNNAQASYMRGVLKINYGNQGWSERYVLNATSGTNPVATYPNAVLQLNEIAGYRAKLLGAGCVIVYGSVSLSDSNRDSVKAITTPIPAALVDGETTVETINRVEDCFVFRFDDQLGHYDIRAIRGLRDSWIADAKATGSLPGTMPTISSAFAPVAGGSGNPTPGNAIFNYLLAVMSYSVGLKVNKASNPGTFLTFPLNTVSYNGTGNRKTGHPFGLSVGKAPTRM